VKLNHYRISAKKESVMVQRDYTGKALFTLLLYFCGYLPGLLVNIILLFLAWGDRDRFGDAPGSGCLVGLILVCGLGPIAALTFVYVGLHYLY
jgi:hypothetical protein